MTADTPASLAESSRIRAPEGSTPPSDRLIGEDAPLGQEVLNIPKTAAEAKVDPDGVSDDVWRESIAVVAGHGVDHPATLLRATST